MNVKFVTSLKQNTEIVNDLPNQTSIEENVVLYPRLSA